LELEHIFEELLLKLNDADDNTEATFLA